MNMESEHESSDSVSEEEEFYRNLGRGNAFIACESSEKSFKSDADENASSEDEPIAFCLMAKSSDDQVSAKQKSPEYIELVKLIKIAKIQQDELDHLEMNLRKTEGFLVEEMKKNQDLIEKHSAFSSTIEDLLNRNQERYDCLTVDVEN